MKTIDDLRRRSLALSKYSCLIAAVPPTLAAAGWIFHINLLKQIHPSLPAMQPNTVFGLLLSSIAIIFSGENREPRQPRVACMLATVITSLGLLTLAEYVFAWDPGIDRIFLGEGISTGQPFPGRPSPQTSTNFAILGVGVLVYNLRFLPIRLGQVCALAVGANATVAITGYIFQTSQFYGFPTFIPSIGMAVHTAVSFILLAIALLCSRPRDGMMSLVTSDTRSSSMARRILVTAILAPPAVGALTLIGVTADWYPVHVQVSLFVVVLVTLLLRATWQAARQAEQDELQTRAALHETRNANEKLETAIAERRIFEALIENSSDFIGIADANGKPVYVNPAGRRMVGLPGDYPIENTQISEYYPASQLSFVSEVILSSVVDQGHWKGETFFRHWETEGAIPVSDEHFLIRDTETGKVLGMGTVTRDISHARRAQEQIRQSQERFELALRGADLGAWDWDIKTGTVIFNARWAEMRGFGPQEIKSHVDSWAHGVHPDDWPRVQKAVSDYFEGLVPEYEVEFRALTKSGDWIWILDRGKVFTRDDEGKPSRMVGTELDITQRKSLEEQLRFSEAKFSGIVRASADAIICLDENQQITLFNEGAEKIFGYSSSEAIGASVDILIPERLRSIHRQHVAQFSTGGETARRMGNRSAVIVGLRRNGEEFPADAAISRLGVGGKQILTLALRDISELKRIEYEQRFLAEVGAVLTSTLNYQEMLTNVAELVVRDFADFCIVDVVEEESRLKRLQVASRDPSKGWVSDLYMQVPLDRKQPDPFLSVLQSKRLVLMERLSPELIASTSWSEEHLRALRAADVKSLMVVPLLARGKLVGVIALISSSPHRFYGQADAHLAEELARRAALSIENARLFDEAQRAVGIRDEVLAIVAHDLGNHLTPIAITANVLHQADQVDQAKLHDFTGRILQSADQMFSLIVDLQDFARIQSGTFSVVKKSHSLLAIVDMVIDSARVQVEAKQQTLEVDLPSDLPHVMADARRIGQVISNLLGNAIKFTPEGGTIRLSARRRANTIVTCVSDTGPGIAPEHLSKVFDRFWQAQRKSKGSGLGLSIAKGVIEAHGGTIWAESQAGQGSSLFFTVPIVGV